MLQRGWLYIAVYLLPIFAVLVTIAHGLHLIITDQWDKFRTLGGALIAAVIGYIISELRAKGINKS